jgi:ABC-type transport system involved in Fe-S cluster assembly fused permease/ATPase subunit
MLSKSILEVNPKDVMRNRPNAVCLFKQLLPLLLLKQKKIQYFFIITFFLVFMLIGLDIAIPLFLKNIVFLLTPKNKSLTYALILLLVAYGTIWMLSQIIQQLRQITMIRPLEECINQFCDKLFEHLHSLPLQYHLERNLGGITNALERAEYGLRDVFCGLFLFIIPLILELIIAAFILSFFYGIVYGFILILIAIFYIIFTLYATEWASHFQTLSNKKQASTNSNIVDSFINYANIKYFNQQGAEFTKCNHNLQQREKLLIKSTVNMELVRVGQSLIVGLGLILLTYTAGKKVLLHIYDVSDFILINGYVLQFISPLSHMGVIVKAVRKGINDLEDVMSIYNEKSHIKDESSGLIIKEVKGIVFKNVSFGYKPSRLILKDASFEVKKGETLGIIGQTGSGKSTLPYLLFKFFDVNSGQILINNKDIQTINIDKLRNLFGIVPQDITLFNTSIYENILFARPDATKEEVEKVIELSCLEETLKNFPESYHTIVGERGLKLSGGEKQRIAIARVLLKEPQVYILDEATSCLDSVTEEKVMKNIAPYLKRATTIIIAHRLSALNNADKVITLHNGRLEMRSS